MNQEREFHEREREFQEFQESFKSFKRECESFQRESFKRDGERGRASFKELSQTKPPTSPCRCVGVFIIGTIASKSDWY